MDVAACLRHLGLEQYGRAFRENDVDAEVLPELTAEDLIGLGVLSIGHRRKLLAGGQPSDRDDPLERRSSYRAARLAHLRWALPGGSPPRPGGGHPQARRSMAGSRGGGDNEPDAMQTRRRAGLDHYPCARASRAARDRTLRPDATAGRNDQRRGGRDAAGHLRPLGPQAYPQGRTSRHPAHAFSTVADPRCGA